MTPVVVLHEAEIELWETVQFYESRCVGLGLDFEKEIKAAVEAIQQSPERGAIGEGGTRRYLVHRFPYFVVYIHHKNQVWVMAFAHCSRRPEYWSARAGRTEPRRR